MDLNLLFPNTKSEKDNNEQENKKIRSFSNLNKGNKIIVSLLRNGEQKEISVEIPKAGKIGIGFDDRS